MTGVVIPFSRAPEAGFRVATRALSAGEAACGLRQLWWIEFLFGNRFERLPGFDTSVGGGEWSFASLAGDVAGRLAMNTGLPRLANHEYPSLDPLWDGVAEAVRASPTLLGGGDHGPAAA